MLIPSERHTAKDRALWASLEAADRVHGDHLRLGKKAHAAMQEIRRYAARGPCYCGVSWGKDSVVVADLVCRASRLFDLTIPLVWVRVEPICNPDCPAVRDAFFAMHDAPYHEIRVECRHDETGWHATGTLEAGFRETAQIAGGTRHVSGIRAEESGMRKLSVRTAGVSTKNSCRPLAHWSSQDIFGWLSRKDLPVHPAYAMLGGGRWERGRIRVSSLGGRRGDGIGRTEWEREYYGDVLRRLGLDR